MSEFRDRSGRVRRRPHTYYAGESFVAIPGPVPVTGPGGGTAPGGGLPPLPTSLTPFQQRAGTRAGLDPVALKLGYFPLPWVQQYLSQVQSLQTQVASLQSTLSGVQGELSTANTWLGQAVTAFSPLTAKTYTGQFDTIQSIPTDITSLGSQITGAEQTIGTLTGTAYKPSDVFGGAVGKDLTTFKGQLTTTLGTAAWMTGGSYAPSDVFKGFVGGDLANLKTNIAALDNYLNSLTGSTYAGWDIYTGRFLADLQAAVQYLQGMLTSYSNRLTSANGVLSGILSNIGVLTGNTYTPTSFDTVPLSQIGSDLGALANALGPSGIGGYMTSLTGVTYGPKDLLSGRFLNDLKSFITSSMTTDVVALQNLTLKLFNLTAQAARDFVALAQLHGFNPTLQILKSQDSLNALRPDDFGNMQDLGVGSETPEGSGFDGWEGDSMQIWGNSWHPNQFDAVGDLRRMGAMGFLRSRPFQRARQYQGVQTMYAAIPSGINTGDYGQDMIINWGDGNWEHNMGGPVHTFGAGTFTPSIQPLVQDQKTGRYYGGPYQDANGNFNGGIWHNFRTHKFGLFPYQVVNVKTQNGAEFAKDGAGNIYNMAYQVVNKQGTPLEDGATVVISRRENGDMSDFVSRHVFHTGRDYPTVKTQTTQISFAPSAAGPWSSPQTMSGLALAEIDPNTGCGSPFGYCLHHNYITPLRNPRVALHESY